MDCMRYAYTSVSEELVHCRRIVPDPAVAVKEESTAETDVLASVITARIRASPFVTWTHVPPEYFEVRPSIVRASYRIVSVSLIPADPYRTT